MTLTTMFFFGAGLALLIAGAELLVRGASRLAGQWGITPLVIGLTVVAFGTSAPELAVSVQSGLSGQGDLALGNVIGSNIFNVLFILGIAALITPLSVSVQLIRLDVPIMITASLLTLALGWNGVISRLDGGILFLGMLAYTGYMIYASRHGQITSPEAEMPDDAPAPRLWWISTLLVLAGLGLLVLGSRWLVEGAVAFARMLGVSEMVIGLTLVAMGTSLPEVVTSIIASLRGERDIAVGNVVGSNIFNLLSVLGVAGMVAPEGIPVNDAERSFDIPVMIAVALACLPIFMSGGRISRGEGALFLGYFFAYTLYLLLAAAEHDLLPLFSRVMLYFVAPLTLITLAILLLTALRRR